MRILLANTGHPADIKGGAEAAALDLARALAGRGHHVALAVHHDGRRIDESQDGDVRVYRLPNRNLYYGFDGGSQRPAPMRLAWHAVDSANPLMASAFGEVLDRERPDVVNTHVLVGLSQLVWRAAARRGLPIVHYLHEYGTMCPRGSAFRDGHLCERPCTSCGLLTAPRRRLSRLVGDVVGVSRFTVERHLGWGFFPNARRHVLPNIFNGLAFRPAPKPTGSPLRLGYFARLIPDKGPELLLDAVRRLPPEGWTLDIAGTGEPGYVEALRRDAPPNVRFLDWTRPADFFGNIDVCVVPSIWPDPQPRTVFESYMHGVPVIGARAGGIPEQIDEGRTGWLFEAGSASGLADLLAARLADRADRTIDPGAFQARLAALDPDRVVARYEAIFEDAVRRQVPAGRDVAPPLKPLNSSL